jgi:hypothetical protein
MKKEKEIKSSKQALEDHFALRSRWSNETALSQRILIYCASLLEKLVEGKPRKRARTQWQAFLSAEMKKGMSIQQCAKRWRGRKLRRAA